MSEEATRVTVRGERDVYGDGTVVSVEGDCTNVRWDSDGKTYWSLTEDLETLLPTPPEGDA